MTHNSHLAFYTAVVGAVLVLLCLPFLPVLHRPNDVHDHVGHSSDNRARPRRYMPRMTDSTRLLRIHEVGNHRGRNHSEDKDSIMLSPIFAQHEQSSQPKYSNSQTQIKRDIKEHIEFNGGSRRTAQLSTATNATVVTTDKSEYYDGEVVFVRFDSASLDALCGSATPQCWVGLFPHDAVNYSQTESKSQVQFPALGAAVSLTFTTGSLPAVNSTYKAVVAFESFDLLHILGMSNTFDVLPNSAVLATDITEYFEGQWIYVTYSMNEIGSNLEYHFAHIALFEQNVSNYSLPAATVWNDTTIWSRTGTVSFSSRNLPALNTNFKAVMAISSSDPIRILGVSNNFTVLPNYAVLATDKTQYFDGEAINLAYTMNLPEHNSVGGFATLALFDHNVEDYNVPPAALWQHWSWGNSGTITLSSRILPIVNKKYKAVMVVTDSDPRRILGVSNTFTVRPNSAVLASDNIEYYDGEYIMMTYSTNPMAHNLQGDFATFALFTDNISDYSLPPAAVLNPWLQESSGHLALSSRYLPALNTNYKAVMAISGSDPLRVLGVSNSFKVLPNSAALATDKTQYFEGELINVTYIMTETARNLESGFAWVAFFAHNVSDYSSLPAKWWSYGISDNTGSFTLSSRNLPILNTKYKAVMALAFSYPPRILGVSNSFTVRHNSAILATDNTEYFDGEYIVMAYSMNQMAHNLEGDFAIIAFFTDNTSDYSLPPAGWLNPWIPVSPGHLFLSTRYLPVLNTNYKAVMAILGSDPLRILGVSNAFKVLPNSAALATDKTQYFEGELINVTYIMTESARNLASGFAWVAFFAHNVSDYSSPPAVWWTYEISDNTGSLTFPSKFLPILNTKYKVVMVLSFSDPLRILGVSNSFTLLPNPSVFATDYTEYTDGEYITMTYEMAVNIESFVASVSLFPSNVSDYSLPDAPSFNVWLWSSSGSFAFPSSYLPVLNTDYKAVIDFSGSDPLRILGVSNAFKILPNSAALVTDKSQYFDGEKIQVTYTMNETAHNLLLNDAVCAALFAQNVSDYSSPPASWSYYWLINITGNFTLSSRNLPILNTKYKVVMALANSDPLRIFGVSNSFSLLPNSSTLVTDNTEYFDGELIILTYVMNEMALNLEAGFAIILLFVDNVSDYSLPPAALLNDHILNNTGNVALSTRYLPDLNTKYKAVMAISGSDPLQILGASNAFKILPNSATLTTDKTQYTEGTFVYVTYTMSATVANLENGFAWVGLFPQDVHNFSLSPVTQSLSSSSQKSDTIAVSTMNLPYLNTTYKAVMVITDSKPLRILGISQPFLVVPPKGHPPDETSAKWNFSDIQAVFVGNDLKRCEGRANIAPANRSKCSPRRTCFFGNQNCTAVGAFPATRCSCRGTGSKKTWSCKLAVCPKSKNDPII